MLNKAKPAATEVRACTLDVVDAAWDADASYRGWYDIRFVCMATRDSQNEQWNFGHLACKCMMLVY